MELKREDYIELIRLALKEDIGSGDITTDAIITPYFTECSLVSKSNGVLCGSKVFSDTFKEINENIDIKWNFRDGDTLSIGDLVAELRGDVSSLLMGERTALNFIQRLSGIATKSRRFSDEIKDYKTKILDTRKTLPGFRYLDKYAVSIGGCLNHRIGLFDMVLIKENHIHCAGSIKEAIEQVKRKYGKRYLIEIETTNLFEVKEAIKYGVDIILLDNMPLEMIREAVDIVNGRAMTEASGNVNIDMLREIASTGVDRISVGELTHSLRAFDFSILFKYK